MSKKNVLGKGMAALLNTHVQNANSDQPTENKEIKANEANLLPSTIDINSIEANIKQPRKIFNDKDIEELANSIQENGIIQPLIVKLNNENNKFEIIAGERRFRAAKKIGLKKVPVVVKKVTEKDKLAMAIIENVQRVNLNCVEEALAYFQLMEEFSLTQEDVAKKIGKDRSTIANFLRILRLPKEIIIMLQNEKLSFGHAKVLASIKEETKAIRIANIALQENLSVREMEKKIKELDPKTKDQIDKNKLTKKFNEEIDLVRQKLEKRTGFHFDIKKNEKNKGLLTIKFSNEAEFNDILEFLLN